jgi:hypothetical protein
MIRPLRRPAPLIITVLPAKFMVGNCALIDETRAMRMANSLWAWAQPVGDCKIYLQ